MLFSFLYEIKFDLVLGHNFTNSFFFFLLGMTQYDAISKLFWHRFLVSPEQGTVIPLLFEFLSPIRCMTSRKSFYIPSSLILSSFNVTNISFFFSGHFKSRSVGGKNKIKRALCSRLNSFT